MLYKRWKTFSDDKTKAEAERTGEGIIINTTTKELAFRRRLSGVVCKPPYAAISGNSLCGER